MKDPFPGAYACGCGACQEVRSPMTPEQQSGYAAATVAVTPTIINLNKTALAYAEAQAAAAGMMRDKWVEEQIHRGCRCSRCGFERRNHHDPLSYDDQCLNPRTP